MRLKAARPHVSFLPDLGVRISHASHGTFLLLRNSNEQDVHGLFLPVPWASKNFVR